MKELVAGLALVGLASVSKSRSGGTLAGSDDFHFGKFHNIIADGYILLNTRTSSCEASVRNAVAAYGMAEQAFAHVDSMSGPSRGSETLHRERLLTVNDLKSKAMQEIAENSCAGDSKRLRQKQTGRYY